MSVLFRKPRRVKPALGSRLDTGHPLAVGLRDLWLMNETTYDRAHNLAYPAGMLSNAGLHAYPTVTAGPYGGPALKFDGSSYAGLSGYTVTFAIPSTGTLLAVYRHEATIATTVNRIWTSTNATTLDFSLITYSDGKIYGGWYNTGTDNRVTVSSSVVEPGRWNHWALTWVNGGPTRLYLNGRELGSTPTMTAFWSTAGIPQAWGYGPDANATGSLDHGAIWTRALAPEEVQQLYVDPYAHVLQPSTKRWLLPPAPAGAATYTASVSATAGAATAAAAATFTPPTYSATAAPSAAPTTASAAATFTAPVYTATVSATAAPATAASTATFTALVHTATVSATAAPATAAVAATFIAPVYTATVSATVGHAAAAASAEFATAIFLATASATAAPATAAATATFTAPVYTATVSTSAAHATALAAAMFVPLTYTAAVSVTAAPVTVSAAAAYTPLLPVTSLTLHCDASTNSQLYTAYGPPPSGTPVDGSRIQVWEDMGDGVGDVMPRAINVVTDPPTWRQAAPLMALPCLDFDGVGNHFDVMDQAGTSYLASSAFLTASDFDLLFAFHLDAAPTGDNDIPTLNTTLLRTDSAGISFKVTGGVTCIVGWNYDGGYDTVLLPVTVGESHVVRFRHTGGNIYLSLDGGAESSAASGDSTSLTGQVIVGRSGIAGTYFPGRIGEFAIYNDGSLGNAALDYFLGKWLPGQEVYTASAVATVGAATAYAAATFTAPATQVLVFLTGSVQRNVLGTGNVQRNVVATGTAQRCVYLEGEVGN